MVTRRIAARLAPARLLGSSAAFAAAILASQLASPEAANACTVCYGTAADPVIEGTRWSIVFLLVLTYLLVGTGAALFVLARRRSLGSRKLP